MDNKEYRPRLNEDEMKLIESFRNGNISSTESNDYSAPFVLSAWSKDGTIMDINEYCEVHGLPREDITSYKLITHSKNPFYNTVFKENIENIESVNYNEVIDGILDSRIKNREISKFDFTKEETITRLIYTDTHIAMCTDIEGTSMYATPWNEEALMKTLEVMCAQVIHNRDGAVLIIDELGDFLDGWNGQTTRGGHSLPQNMGNEEAFRVGLEFKVRMIEILLPYFTKIVCHNVCIDNHSGSFSGILNHSFKRIAESMSNKVEVINLSKFIEHYYIGKHAFVLSHGKDHKSLKFGFKPKLDSVQIEKIDHYLKHNEKGSIYKEAEFIHFDKGDSHQMLFDYSTAQDFNYNNYPALSPSSEWVMTNFKKGDRGFVIQHINPQDRNIKVFPIII